VDWRDDACVKRLQDDDERRDKSGFMPVTCGLAGRRLCEKKKRLQDDDDSWYWRKNGTYGK
jgi:hypothetical protein